MATLAATSMSSVSASLKAGVKSVRWVPKAKTSRRGWRRVAACKNASRRRAYRSIEPETSTNTRIGKGCSRRCNRGNRTSSPPVCAARCMTPGQCMRLPRCAGPVRRETKCGSGKCTSRTKRSISRNSLLESALKSACFSRSRSLAVITASNSTFWSSCFGFACCPKAL